MKQPKKIKELLETSRLGGLLAQARALQAMDALLSQLLPRPLNAHCRILSIRNCVLAVAADSPAWAARLRFHAPQLAEALARRFSDRRYTIHVRVRPAEIPRSQQPQRTVMQRGTQATAALQQAAQSVSDPALKSALLRLANRVPGHQA